MRTNQVIVDGANTTLSFERVKPKFICSHHYIKRSANFAGKNCWLVVVGYDNNHFMDFDLVPFLAKPTKRQLRKLKRECR